MEQTDENQDVAPLRISKNKTTALINWGAWLVATVLLTGYFIISPDNGPLRTMSNTVRMAATAIAALGAAYSLLRFVQVLNSGNVYTFDRASDSVTLDGKPIGKLSDIKTVLLKQMRTIAVDLVFKSGHSERLATYPRAEQAVAIAEQIANYAKLNISEGWGLF